MPTLAELTQIPNPLARHYSRFRVSEKLLLTGHSHQAWPDVGFEGQAEAWKDAAEWLDDKWDHAGEKADRVRQGFARLLGAGARADEIALGSNTHELVLRFLSALPLAKRPRLVTTDGEFHTIRRQFDRLAEEPWLTVVKVKAHPVATLAERLISTLDDRTAAVLVSSVLFEGAEIVPGLDALLAACRRMGAELLVDAYHHLNVVPFSLDQDGLGEAFVTGGGYKYCQLGESNCFLRVPPGREALRPILTGWYSEFAALADEHTGRVVPYGAGPARWAGATYDPTSHYRASRVFDFFESQDLAPSLLREASQHQIGVLAAQFDAQALDPRAIDRDRSVPLSQIAGFLALHCPQASEVVADLRARGVWADSRGETLRLGPAPYLSDEQLVQAVETLGSVVRIRSGGRAPARGA